MAINVIQRIASYLYLIINWLIFETYSGCYSIFPQLNARITAYWKYLPSFVFELLFFFYPIWIVNIWSTTSKIYFMTFAIHRFKWIKKKQRPLIDFSKLIWYLRSDSKNSTVISGKFYIAALWLHYTHSASFA